MRDKKELFLWHLSSLKQKGYEICHNILWVTLSYVYGCQLNKKQLFLVLSVTEFLRIDAFHSENSNLFIFQFLDFPKCEGLIDV